MIKEIRVDNLLISNFTDFKISIIKLLYHMSMNYYYLLEI